MVLSPKQIHELLSIIDTNQSALVLKQLGPNFLSTNDKSLLDKSGLDWKTLYNPAEDSIFTNFNFGLLAQALDDNSAIHKLSYGQLKEYIKQGNYIPLTQREQSTIDSIKAQTFSDIKRLGGNIFQDINGIVNNKSQEQFLRDEIEEGVRKKKTVKEIASEIARKTGDWNRNFQRIIQFQCNDAYQAGRAAMIEKDYGKDVEVYKKVFSTACEHCVKLYLTKGIGSEPRIFKLSELRANGTNIGRKTSEWKPTLGSLHPWCRCLLFYKQPNSWNPKTQTFDIVSKETSPKLKVERKPIRISIAGRELQV